MRRPYRTFPVISTYLLAAALTACGGADGTDDSAAAGASDARSTAECNGAAVREVVDRFGRSLQQVSLLAPDSLLDRALREHYDEFVTPALLAQWRADPALAPGRLTSSPWPDRIDVSSAAGDGDGCVVQGEIVYATSTDSAGSEALREEVTLRLEQSDEGWRISAFEQENGASGANATRDDTEGPVARDAQTGVPPGAGNPDGATSQGGDAPGRDRPPAPEEAAEVIRRYYTAIAAGDYARAYRLWSENGAASGQTLEAFTRGYAETSNVQVQVGAPTDLEGAAGSLYVKVPVVVRAVTVNGERQHFEGTYTLRRSNVDGATAEQRAWRIYDAAISAAPADSDA